MSRFHCRTWTSYLPFLTSYTYRTEGLLVWKRFYEFVLVLQESCKEDEALEPLLDAVRVLTVMLRKTEGESDKEPGYNK